MSADLDELLRTSATTGQQPDPDELWRQGRLRRRRRTVTTSMAGVAVLAVAVAVPVLTDPGTQPVIESVGQQDGAGVDDTERPAGMEDDLIGGGSAGETSGTASEELQRQRAELQREDIAAGAELEAEQAGDDEANGDEATSGQTSESDTADAGSDDAGSAASEPGPTPDAALMDDPCQPHEGGEMRTFIDVVSPAEGQGVSGSLELVGCSSVYEGTVQYRVLDDGGSVILDGFTTATAGGPEIGEFRETVTLPGGSTAAAIEVYWEDAADGSDRDVQRVELRGS